MDVVQLRLLQVVSRRVRLVMHMRRPRKRRKLPRRKAPDGRASGASSPEEGARRPRQRRKLPGGRRQTA
eukprot:9616295-Heterocapsa_arctica.AAC.1